MSTSGHIEGRKHAFDNLKSYVVAYNYKMVIMESI